MAKGRCLTPRSSGPPTARHPGREAVLYIIGYAARAPRCRRPLNSHVRQHKATMPVLAAAMPKSSVFSHRRRIPTSKDAFASSNAGNMLRDSGTLACPLLGSARKPMVHGAGAPRSARVGCCVQGTAGGSGRQSAGPPRQRGVFQQRSLQRQAIWQVHLSAASPRPLGAVNQGSGAVGQGR